MVAKRRSPAAPSGTSFADAIDVVSKTIEKATVNGGANARATIDAQNDTIKTIGGELAAACERVAKYEAVCQKMLAEYGKMAQANGELALVASREKIALAELGADNDWKMKLLELCGPALPPALRGLLAKAGLAQSDAALLAGDGSKEGDEDAALLRVALAIQASQEAQAAIIKAAGAKDWDLAVSALLRFHAAKSSTPPTHANGAAN